MELENLLNCVTPLVWPPILERQSKYINALDKRTHHISKAQHRLEMIVIEFVYWQIFRVWHKTIVTGGLIYWCVFAQCLCLADTNHAPIWIWIGEYGSILSLLILEHDLYQLNILWVLRQGCQEWMVEGPRKERRAGSATRAWNKPSDTSSTITLEQIITFSQLLYLSRTTWSIL